MRADLFEEALEEAIRYGRAAKLVVTFPGDEALLNMQPLDFKKVGDAGFKIEIHVSDQEDSDVVDHLVFVDAEAVESVELLVKPQGSVWQDQPTPEMEDEAD